MVKSITDLPNFTKIVIPVEVSSTFVIVPVPQFLSCLSLPAAVTGCVASILYLNHFIWSQLLQASLPFVMFSLVELENGLESGCGSGIDFGSRCLQHHFGH